MYYAQSEYRIRCEWGIEGIQQLAPDSDAFIIVDVFSFSTCVDIALSRGARVFPYAWRDDRSAAYAESIGAVLAAGSRSDPQHYSLAPSSMLRLPPDARVVLPSPNGSTLSLATGSTPTFTACLRNAKAVAKAALKAGSRISVIPSGERWKDDSLRPALEDQIGAGAIVHELTGDRSPEAEAAEAVFLRFRDDLFNTLAACSSGKEAAARGSVEDVRLAAALNASAIVPRLVNGAYQHAYS